MTMSGAVLTCVWHPPQALACDQEVRLIASYPDLEAVRVGDGLKEQLEALRGSHAATQHRATQQLEEVTARCAASEAAAAEASRKNSARPLWLTPAIV
jgi:hypothetical protein